MKKITYLIAIIGCSMLTFAQNDATCGTDAIHKRLMEIDATYKAKFESNQKKIRNQVLSNKVSGKLTTTQYTIPVVVHVIHLGEAVGTGTNISDAQIQSAIDNMNDAYAGTASYVTDMNLDFVLAKRDGDCNASIGIVRVDGSGTSDYSTEGITGEDGSDNEEAIKNLSKYPNDEFYNIWIVSEIDGNNAGSGTQGYAYFPGAPSSVDGAVILYNAFGYDPTGALGYTLKSDTNENVTATHEMGHAFNLYHTFEGDDADDDGTADQCPVNTDPSSDGDACADTDPHMRDDGNCGDTGETCTGTGTNLADIVTNFMAYSSETCQVKFSDNQRDRARTALETTRWTLINSSGGLAPTTSPSATLSSTPATDDTSNGFGVGVYGLTIGANASSSGGAVTDVGYHDNSCSSFDLSSSTMYSIEVRTGPANNEHVRVYIDYNNDGDFVDSGEEVFSNANTLQTHSGSFTVPAISASVIADTPLWVRVISDFASISTNFISGSDYEPNFGQVEDFSIIIDNSSLSVDSKALANELKIFPNPNSGEFTLNYKGASSLERLSVFNVIGKEVASLSLKGFNDNKEIDLSGIQSGMYFVKIISEESEATKKIIIK